MMRQLSPSALEGANPHLAAKRERLRIAFRALLSSVRCGFFDQGGDLLGV